MSDRRWWWMLPVLLVVMLVGTHNLDVDAIWYDEARAMFYAGVANQGVLSAMQTIERVADNLMQVPAYYLSLNLWTRLVGETVFANRALSVFYGLLAVAVTYRVGRVLVSPLAGLGAATAFGVSGFFIYYLHEMRTYTLLPLLAMVAVWSYWRLINGKHDLPGHITFFLSVLALPYSHYYGVCLPIGLGIYHLLFVPKRREWLRPVLLMGLAGLLFVPWLGITLDGASYVSENRERLAFSNREYLLELGRAFSSGNLIFLALVGAYGINWTTRGRRFVLVLLVATFAVTVAINAVTNSLAYVRYVIVLFPLMGLLVGVGIDRLARSGLNPALLLVLWALPGLWLGFFGDIRETEGVAGLDPLGWDGMTAAVDGIAKPGDLIAINMPDNYRDWTNDLAAQYYLRNLFADHMLVQHRYDWSDEYFMDVSAETAGDARRVWSVREVDRSYGRTDDFETVLLDEGFLPCGEIHTDETTLMNVYAQPDRSLASVTFGGQTTLRVIDLSLQPDGDTLPVVLVVDVTGDVPPETYSVALHITDMDGNVLKQVDFPLPEAGESCAVYWLSLDSVTPGVYSLLGTVYAWQTGDRLPVSTASGETTLDDRALLGLFQVAGE